MRLATIRIAGKTRAARLEGETFVGLGVADLGVLLTEPGWRSRAAVATGPEYAVRDVSYAPVVPRPGKVLCVGLNYRNHILEMGRELPEYPTIFAKFAEALIGAHDDIALAPESSAIDWEAELAVVIGRAVRRADADEAAAAIAGFTVLNDVTMRDWQFRTNEWLQGKTFEGTTPVGPVLVTPDELPGGVRPSLTMTCAVGGEMMQKADTSDLVFDPVELVRYASAIITLKPGDIIATGTPGGVGHAQNPPRYLADGMVLTTEIDGIGVLRNHGIGKLVFWDDLSSFNGAEGVTGAEGASPGRRAKHPAAARSRPHQSQEHHASTLHTGRPHNSARTGQQSGHRVCEVRSDAPKCARARTAPARFAARANPSKP